MFCLRHCQITYFSVGEETSGSGKLPWRRPWQSYSNRSSSWSSVSFRAEAWIFTDSTCKFYEWLIYFKVVLTDQTICNLFHAATESPCSCLRSSLANPVSALGWAYLTAHPIASAAGMVALELQDWQCAARGR